MRFRRCRRAGADASAAASRRRAHRHTRVSQRLRQADRAVDDADHRIGLREVAPQLAARDVPGPRTAGRRGCGARSSASKMSRASSAAADPRERVDAPERADVERGLGLAEVVGRLVAPHERVRRRAPPPSASTVLTKRGSRGSMKPTSAISRTPASRSLPPKLSTNACRFSLHAWSRMRRADRSARLRQNAMRSS